MSYDEIVHELAENTTLETSNEAMATTLKGIAKSKKIANSVLKENAKGWLSDARKLQNSVNQVTDEEVQNAWDNLIKH